MSGYQENFMGKKVSTPRLSKRQLEDTIFVGHEYLLSHDHYSTAICKSRKLAWFSSANMDASLKKKINREQLTSTWKTEVSLGKEDIINDKWYKSSKKWFQRGHLTPADVMEWGTEESAAISRANDTFYFSNAAPQIARLNGREWRMLEAYIGKECAKSKHTRLCVHTGSVLHNDDPAYLNQHLEGFKLLIPRLFWKVVYYLNPSGKLCRVGFLMGQTDLLIESKMVEEIKVTKDADGVEAFLNLGDQKTFAVDVKIIEQLTGLKMMRAAEKPKNMRPHEILLKEVEVPLEKGIEMLEFSAGVRSDENPYLVQTLEGLDL